MMSIYCNATECGIRAGRSVPTGLEMKHEGAKDMKWRRSGIKARTGRKRSVMWKWQREHLNMSYKFVME